jgi:putative ABC transport system permease protein
MALGARPNTVQWMILREGSFMLAGGIVIGLLLAIATGKILSGILYQEGALDPIAFSIAPLLLAAATLLATWLPARRATRISPMMALRTESTSVHQTDLNCRAPNFKGDFQAAH